MRSQPTLNSAASEGSQKDSMTPKRGSISSVGVGVGRSVCAMTMETGWANNKSASPTKSKVCVR